MSTPPDTSPDSAEERPTRLQQPPAGQRRTAESVAGLEPPTRAQSRAQPTGGNDSARTRAQGAHGRSAGPPSPFGVPPALATRYEFERIVGAGGEADVWLAHPHDEAAPADVAVKVYRPGVEVDLTLIARLNNPSFHRHVPVILEYGREELPDGRRVAWEAMEYFPIGSLIQLTKTEAGSRGRLAAKRAEMIVGEISAALTFWEDVVKARQMDLSPGNVLVRHSDSRRVELVLSDFGGVVGTGQSQWIGDVRGKAAYLPPEAALARNRDPKSPWWSLGVIAHELVTGRPLWGDDIHDEALQIVLATAEVPELTDLPDGRWGLLLSGLLTREPVHRWSGPQVQEWLAGGSPSVWRSAKAQDRSVPPITYRDREYRDPAVLVAQLTQDGEGAAEWIAGGGAAALESWLQKDVMDSRFDRSALRRVAGDALQARYAVAALAATFIPETTPRYQGHPVDDAGLATLAAQGGPGELLREIVESRVLSQSARHRCAHPGCPDAGRCTVLARIADEVPHVVKAVRADWLALKDELDTTESTRIAFPRLADSHLPFAPEELGRVYRDAVTMTLGHRKSARPTLPELGNDLPDWWNRRYRAALAARTESASGRAAVISAAALAPHASTYGENEKRVREQLRREEMKRRRQEEEQRRRRRRPVGWVVADLEPKAMFGRATAVGGLQVLGSHYFRSHDPGLALATGNDQIAAEYLEYSAQFTPTLIFCWIMLLVMVPLGSRLNGLDSAAVRGYAFVTAALGTFFSAVAVANWGLLIVQNSLLRHQTIPDWFALVGLLWFGYVVVVFVGLYYFLCYLYLMVRSLTTRVVTDG